MKIMSLCPILYLHGISRISSKPTQINKSHAFARFGQPCGAVEDPERPGFSKGMLDCEPGLKCSSYVGGGVCESDISDDIIDIEDLYDEYYSDGNHDDYYNENGEYQLDEKVWGIGDYEDYGGKGFFKEKSEASFESKTIEKNKSFLPRSKNHIKNQLQKSNKREKVQKFKKPSTFNQLSSNKNYCNPSKPHKISINREKFSLEKYQIEWNPKCNNKVYQKKQCGINSSTMEFLCWCVNTTTGKMLDMVKPGFLDFSC